MNAGDDRLTRIEEALGFADRAAEELGAEVLRLNQRLADVLKRLEALERRVDGIGEEEAEGD